MLQCLVQSLSILCYSRRSSSVPKLLASTVMHFLIIVLSWKWTNVCMRNMITGHYSHLQ
jgi:hypothetical protein